MWSGYTQLMLLLFVCYLRVFVCWVVSVNLFHTCLTVVDIPHVYPFLSDIILNITNVILIPTYNSVMNTCCNSVWHFAKYVCIIQLYICLFIFKHLLVNRIRTIIQVFTLSWINYIFNRFWIMHFWIILNVEYKRTNLDFFNFIFRIINLIW